MWSNEFQLITLWQSWACSWTMQCVMSFKCGCSFIEWYCLSACSRRIHTSDSRSCRRRGLTFRLCSELTSGPHCCMLRCVSLLSGAVWVGKEYQTCQSAQLGSERGCGVERGVLMEVYIDTILATDVNKYSLTTASCQQRWLTNWIHLDLCLGVEQRIVGCLLTTQSQQSSSPWSVSQPITALFCVYPFLCLLLSICLCICVFCCLRCWTCLL